MFDKNLTLAIVNKSSRTTPIDAEHILQRHLGANLKCVDFDPDAIDAQIDEYLEECQAPIIAWGGDGTICCALEAIDNRLPLLALPGGTMNLVHKEIHGADMDCETLLRAATRDGLEEQSLTRARANGRSFFVAALVGNLTKLTDAREAIRDGRPLSAALGFMSDTTFDLDHVFTVGGHEACDEAAALAAFINNQDKTFDIGTINPNTLADLMAVSLEAGLKDWREADRVNFTQKSALQIEGAYERIHVTLDGEAREMKLPLSLKLEPKGARVLAPRS
jgi:diacylglycerol kinase family enzyme